MTLQELLDKCRNDINSEAVFQEIVAEHDKQIRADAIKECVKFVDEWDGVIADALEKNIKEKK